MAKREVKAGDIYPFQIVRKHKGGPYFGYAPNQIDEKIKTGEIPAPIPLSATGRAMGWTGQMIIDHHAELMKLAAKRAAEAKADELAAEADAKHFPKSKAKPKSTRRSMVEA